MSAGMSGVEARRRAEWMAELDAALTAAGADAAARRAWWVPGRLEFLGKHTDYCGGRSLACAIERGICLVAAPRGDDRIRLHDIRSGEVAVTGLTPSEPPSPGHWSNYALTVARRIARNFPGARRGADIAFASDLPAAAGMSSSSALVVAVFLALADVNQLRDRQEYRRNIPDDDALADYLGAVENGKAFADLSGDMGVGTAGGSQDQTAILRSRSGALVQYAFIPTRFEQAVALPDRYRFVIAASGIVAEKTGAARARYNAASAAAAAILEQWRRVSGRDDPSLAAAVASSADAADQIRSAIRSPSGTRLDAGALVDRFEQFQTESGMIVPAAAEALSQEDLTAVGALVDLSQECAERLLGNQVPETAELARSARTLGAAAASAFGAGFGGSVWAMVPDEEADEFARRWARSYTHACPDAAQRAEFFVTRAGPAAIQV